MLFAVSRAVRRSGKGQKEITPRDKVQSAPRVASREGWKAQLALEDFRGNINESRIINRAENRKASERHDYVRTYIRTHVRWRSMFPPRNDETRVAEEIRLCSINSSRSSFSACH